MLRSLKRAGCDVVKSTLFKYASTFLLDVLELSLGLVEILALGLAELAAREIYGC